LAERQYFQPQRVDGPYAAQIIESGPDRDPKGIREVYFAAILKARKRVWIASPYFVPDGGLGDALQLAGHLGIDVRLLGEHDLEDAIQLDKHVYARRPFAGRLLENAARLFSPVL